MHPVLYGQRHPFNWKDSASRSIFSPSLTSSTCHMLSLQSRIMSEYDSDASRKSASRHMYTLADFRVHQDLGAGGASSPELYYPKVEAKSNVRAPPSVSFSQAPRFSEGSRVLISKHHNADMLGMHSPGPKYNPELVPLPNKAIYWGDPAKIARARRHKEITQRTMIRGAGPSSYVPNIDAVKPVAPAPSFSTAPRFFTSTTSSSSSSAGGEAGAEQGGENRDQDSLTQLVDAQTAFKHTVRSAPSISIGLRNAAHEVDNVNSSSYRPIGPADYMPEGGWRTTLLPRLAPEFSFGKAPRFSAKKTVLGKGGRLEAESLKMYEAAQQARYEQQRNPVKRLTTKWVP